MNVLFRGGRVLDPARNLDAVSDVLVREGRIEAVEPRLPAGLAAGAVEIDARGKWVTPGLIDMHVHLREPGEEYKETIATGTAAAAAGGYTAVACMPNTKPVNDTASVTRYILDRAREEGSCRVFPVGAVSRGQKGEDLAEYGELREAGCVALSDDGRPVMNARLMRRALEYAAHFDLVVISHAEDADLSRGGLMHEGRVATELGLRGIPSAAEDVMVARDVILSELTGSRLHIAHVSTEGALRVIREAKRRGVPVTCETAPHYFTLTCEAVRGFDAVFKMNPPLRAESDRAAVREGLADGTIDCIATDHAPHSVLEKDLEFEFAANGVIGLESALPLVLALVSEGVLSPLSAIAKLTCNPARILGVPHGSLAPGAPADITLIDPEKPRVIDAARFRSKARNCPFHGWETRGEAAMTLLAGRPALRPETP